ncbi:E3 ubiquitin-protein ligase SH3RF3 [Ostrinia nubilalis]|uniref:E3 ubiquitin-protein ligase SH3RF3 n=1 Tax=Ostrinia nubilalis TaxID=29057 RepID=UPI003082211A
MDEGLLNDLLECSVCLERLDTSSRVLPCQHTFCLKCLKVIVESHKELRCPECRILVEAKVEELPPNVLLMRILEGMKNSAPRKPTGSGHRTKAQLQLAQLQQGQQHMGRADGKQMPPHARALHDYISKEQGDLSFKKGDMIILQKKLDPFWYQGECSGRTGMFPITYVQVIVPLPVPTALCKALYDFRMSAPDEEGCLAFDKGAIITVHRRVDENWAEGRLEQRVGIFPIAFVELNQPARHLMNSTPLNRPVPPLPEHARAGHSDHRHHTQHAHRSQQTSLSLGAAGPGGYQPAMAHSHPAYQQPAHPQQVTGVCHFQHAHRSQQTSLSLGAAGPGGYQPAMAHSHPAYQQPAHPQQVTGVCHFQHAHRSQQTSLSLGAAGPGGYQPAMAHSHPAYQQPAHPQQVVVQQPVNQHVISHGLVSREPKHSLDLIHLHLHPHVTRVADAGAGPALGIHAVARVADSCDRLRTKFDPYATSAPIHKIETTYQNVRAHEHFPVNFSSNNASSDSSSSMNTPSSFGVSSTTTPNSSSSASACDSAEPSLPSSPDNNACPPTVLPAPEQESSLNTSMGVLSLNESSTATNTSLNVSLPPSESPKLNASTASNASGSATQAAQNQDATENATSEPRLDAPSSSKTVLRSSGPDSLLNFGLGLQAALSPAHKEYAGRARDKRHSLTPAEHLQGSHATQNRHSAEILTTSLLDHVPERDRDGGQRERERERRRRRSRSNERPLPAAYVALYPYKPQKPDELELKKGAVYTVTERCRDGWYKGCGERSARCGVFPGNYVAPAKHSPRLKHDKAHIATAVQKLRRAHDKICGNGPCEPAIWLSLLRCYKSKLKHDKVRETTPYRLVIRLTLLRWYKGCGERSARCGVFPGNYVAPAKHSPRLKHDKVIQGCDLSTTKYAELHLTASQYGSHCYGWYKGCGERSARCGVFPGNYVAPAKHSPRLKHDKAGTKAAANVRRDAACSPATTSRPPSTRRASSTTRYKEMDPTASQYGSHCYGGTKLRLKHDKICGNGPYEPAIRLSLLRWYKSKLKHDKSTASPVTAVAKPTQAPPPSSSLAPPDAPPRAHSPPNANAQPLTYPWSVSPQAQLQQQQNTPRSEKSKEKSKSEKSSISTGVSLMKRLAAMKKCKSPPPSGYSMDNPVFEDGPGTSLMLNLASQHHPVHVRSGSCPSQLLRALPGTERRHKEHAVLCVHEHARSTNNDGPWQSQHRKSQSLDVTAVRRDRHHSQNVKERFRCIVPYPPNSEYELELKVDDIVVVSRKRGDGWYKGTLQRTGRTGLFPASFVQSCPHE